MAFPGYATKPGHHYHEPAIDDGRPWQRGNADRWQILVANQDWKDKRVIDYGCADGFFGIKALLSGAKKVSAYDADSDAILNTVRQAHLAGTEVENRIEVTGKEPGKPLIVPEADVLLLLSVIPWILKTEINPWDILRSLAASAEVAYVELMYAGDGRAGMAEIKDDADAEKWLLELWPIAYPIGWTIAHSGKRRTLWRCLRQDSFMQEPTHVGSQAFVFVNQYDVMKRARPGRDYNPEHELAVLHELRFETIAPKPIALLRDCLVMTFIQGSPVASGSLSKEFLEREAYWLLDILKTHYIVHNDIRPENLILGKDGHLYLIDYGWASLRGVGPAIPETINPQFRGKDDRETFCKVIDFLCPT